LFPENVLNRIYATENETAMYEPPKTRLKSFLQASSKAREGGGAEQSRQIADLFPETTVLFADIAGFTAWSSVREPSHVFTLLEAIYGAFDAIAAKRGVFKVETIGDAYVAVTGLPEPRKDHAVVMVKFARDCRSICVDITRELEVSLGPGTGDLRYRFGLHSGPVTAGVLRGKKSRFQLFGTLMAPSCEAPNIVRLLTFCVFR
jgi:class 3 adenylate cyclase